MTRETKGRAPKLYQLTSDGTWKYVCTGEYGETAKAFDASDLVALYRKDNPTITYRCGFRRPKARKVRADAISTKAERAAWDVKRVYQLQRQHHKIEMAETRELANESELARVGNALLMSPFNMSGLGVGKFAEATGMQALRLGSHSGTILANLAQGGIFVDGHEIHGMDIVAVGKDLYDIRFLQRAEDTQTILDRDYISATRKVAEVRDVPLDDLLAVIENKFGFSIRNPDPVRLAERLKQQAINTFEQCQCEDCTAARAAAKAKGTNLIAERLTRPDGTGFHKLRAALDTKATEKIAKAKERATLVIPEKETVN